MTFQNWLDAKLIVWTAQQPRGQRTIRAFSDYLGVSLSTMNNWLNRGQQPEGENIARLAGKLGNDLYDVLGLPAPAPGLWRVTERWPALSECQRAAILKIVESEEG